MKYDLNLGTLIIFLTIGSIIYYIKKKKIFNIDYLIFTSCLIYVFYVIKLAFFPIPYGHDYINVLREINNSYGDYSYSNNFNVNIKISELTNFYNLIFLMPATLYFWYYSKKKIIFKLFLISLSIEIFQVIISLIINYPYKIFDINDIILNTSGGILVYLIIFSCERLRKKIYNKQIKKTN